ncbi:hypothetical protein PoB_007651100 [Plakobranchus ocellatus]|uniref:Uncharacterized protein n=1 Tax=Plakobranchus ocellatus TaxID=259542 RepID=A0AAV4E1R3_9GAST|nr:hypothetical protein PoB_007651100 [Plakobranchus ocellatus]
MDAASIKANDYLHRSDAVQIFRARAWHTLLNPPVLERDSVGLPLPYVACAGNKRRRFRMLFSFRTTGIGQCLPLGMGCHVPERYHFAAG